MQTKIAKTANKKIQFVVGFLNAATIAGDKAVSVYF
jgi:hypothetical protein